ncbi:HTH-type transcriptional regulator CdhR [Frondihabitans sp. 762G35]|uniref:helix-turn-helix transcriptional regulator n=1 Tax=Frondihabitans sp. 762G35 TaxID=1446794 RepID=UPI000D21BC38|nr:helix-turn-helix transcriptional regulator [Frondihabitans sp. 762G35]ARC58366.1 HTH-type transcriptional regulator CdhR [Frondihabitans sp. 762G35]
MQHSHLTPAEGRSFETVGTDPRVASAVYAEALGGADLRVTPVSEEFTFRYASLGNDRVALRTSDCAGSLAGDVHHLRDYVVAWFRAGAGLLDLDRFRRRGSTLPFLLPAERRFSVDFTPHRQNLVHFGPAFLEDVATEFHAGPPQPVSFDHEADPDSGLLGRWRTAVSDATAAFLEAATAPLLRFGVELNLARALLALFPWRAWDVPLVLRKPSMAKTRLALDFLQHHAHEPVTPADAARAAGLHTRSLQLATQRHLGVSPSTYLRNVRLDRARTELLRGDPGRTTVGAVAREWGFGNLGRFAAAYQARFAEKPNQTLRR